LNLKLHAAKAGGVFAFLIRVLMKSYQEANELRCTIC